MKRPIWAIVLSHYESKNYISNGLTIPYLIGSSQIISSFKSKFTVESFLKELIESEIKSTIMRCGNINEYVIGLLDSETEKLINEKYPNLYPRFGNLHLQGLPENLSNGISNFMNMLNKEYKTVIDKEQYSKDKGAWSLFSQTDKSRIEEVNKNYHQQCV